MTSSPFRATALLLASLLAPLAQAQNAQPGQASQAVREVQHLLDTVAASRCQFNRNGSWYDSVEARKHLQKKYDYLAERKQAPTAESFIERGASSSSMSGKPYQIRCAGAAPVDSATWLTDQLARYRKSGKPQS
jgi:hypothetical protein